MRTAFLAIAVLTATTFVAPTQAQVVNGTHGKNEGVPPPIGTKAAGPINTEAAARSAAAAHKNERNFKHGSMGNDASSSTNSHSGR